MKVIKILKNFGYIFYFLTGITPIIFIIASLNTDGSVNGVTFGIFGIIFLFLGFVLSSIASIIRDKKLINQPLGLSKDISSYMESKKVANKMFKIGLFAFVGVGLTLISGVIIFFDGGGDNLEKPSLVVMVVLALVGVVSWTLAIMRYFRK